MDFLERKLNRNIPVPLYYQLKGYLEDYIKNEHGSLDVPIPTELEISEAFGVSRPTVRQAINELVVEGKLYRKKSKGTFITKPKINQDFLTSIQSFDDEMRAKGLTPKTKVLGIYARESTAEEAEALQLPLKSNVLCLERCRYADNAPVVYVMTVLPEKECHSLIESDFSNHSLYSMLEDKLGLKIAYATRQLEAIVADIATAKLLNVAKGSPIQFIKTITYLENDHPIEYSQAAYRGDRSQFSFLLKR
ncbi:GntR family transcriptional regulator [Eubacterium aggregans]|uniref:GntR family transcriptional regulator n=1 Tax=Eubacterium aggregans TaxID=81409 RepID=UPI003F3D186A